MSEQNNPLSEEQIAKQEEERKKIEFAQLQKLKLIDLNLYPYRTQEKIIGKYTREQLKKALEAPELEANQKQLRNISKFLYNASSHYKRLVLYFSGLLTLDYYCEPYGFDESKVNVKKLKKSYQDVSYLLENMNIKHELGKVLHAIFRDGIYFGYIHSSKDSFFLQYLDPDYTKITYFEDGVYGLSFNFSYFFIYPERLNMFPQEFRNIYKEKYEGKRKGRSNSNFWEEISSENTITVKFDENSWYPIPPFIGIFDSLLDISDYKDLAKAKEEIGNYKLITMQIPLNEKNGTYNDYLITADHALTFQDNVASVVPEQIGVATIPMKVDVVDFENDKVDKNKVAEYTSQYFSEAGVSQLLFSGDSTGSIGLNNSIKVDEAVAFSMLRQIERWINKYLKKYNSNQFKFRIVMPEISIFNRDKWIETNLKSAQFGIPVKLQLLSSLGLKPSSSSLLTYLENDVLQLDKKFVPLASSHTQPGNGETGAPKKNENDLSDAGTKTKDQQGNENRSTFNKNESKLVDILKKYGGNHGN